ncbi:MAG: response regulator [Comamonadaceae bacterium]|nr:MAG: response regulator [Comamonadaceae bacterium]
MNDQPPTQDAPAAPADVEPVHVLLVEDAPDVRETSHAAMEALGYDVVSVATAEEALERLEAGTPMDILVADISLPGQSGLDLAATVVEQDPSVKVIYASGYGEVSEHLGAPGQSLPKPYDVEQLQAALNEAEPPR